MQQSFEQYFINEQSDFYNYLIDNNAFKSPKTYRDYITRLRYVSQLYRLDSGITSERKKLSITSASVEVFVSLGNGIGRVTLW